MEEQNEKHNEILGAVHEVLEAVGHFSDRMETRMSGVESKLSGVETRLSGVESRLGTVEKRLDSVEGDMVTKSYLDEKLFDLKGDLITLTRKEDAKLIKLVDILESKNVISHDDAGKVLAMEPFPR